MYLFCSYLSSAMTISPTSPGFEDSQLVRKTRLYSMQPKQRKSRQSLPFTRKGTI